MEAMKLDVQGHQHWQMKVASIFPLNKRYIFNKISIKI